MVVKLIQKIEFEALFDKDLCTLKNAAKITNQS